jgi:WD40 repeat protein
VYSFAYAPDGHQVAAGSESGTIRLWNTKTGAIVRKLAGHTEEINCITYSPQGDSLISASDDKTLRLWDLALGQCQAIIHDNTMYDIGWIQIANTQYLMTGCADGSVAMWKVVVNDDDDDDKNRQWKVFLHWKKLTRGELKMEDADIQDVQGLSLRNQWLLKQRGAVGQPAPLA